MNGPTNEDSLGRELTERLPDPAARWLREARDSVRADVATVDTLFPVAGRACGRGPLPDGEPPLRGWTVADAVRVLMLDALPVRGLRLLDVLVRLYGHGDAAERRAVLRALTLLDRHGDLGAAAVPLVEDAVRTNDTRLISAAVGGYEGLGGYAARHLDAAAFRQAVVKCVFTGIPLTAVAGLDERADAELARMLADYARERLAAGRDVPADIWPVVRAHPASPAVADLLAALSRRN
jgi:hypothetical protein